MAPVYLNHDCILAVIHHLKGDHRTLSRLLLLSKQYFPIVAAVLYKDPFQDALDTMRLPLKHLHSPLSTFSATSLAKLLLDSSGLEKELVRICPAVVPVSNAPVVPAPAPAPVPVPVPAAPPAAPAAAPVPAVVPDTAVVAATPTIVAGGAIPASAVVVPVLVAPPATAITTTTLTPPPPPLLVATPTPAPAPAPAITPATIAASSSTSNNTTPMTAPPKKPLPALPPPVPKFTTNYLLLARDSLHQSDFKRGLMQVFAPDYVTLKCSEALRTRLKMQRLVKFLELAYLQVCPLVENLKIGIEFLEPLLRHDMVKEMKNLVKLDVSSSGGKAKFVVYAHTDTRARNMEAVMVELVKKHGEYFPGLLKSVLYSGHGKWPWFGVQGQIMEAMSSSLVPGSKDRTTTTRTGEGTITTMIPPRALHISCLPSNLTEMEEFFKKLDFSMIQDLIFTPKVFTESMQMLNGADQLWDPKILEKCFRLQNADLVIHRPDLFTWAVERKQGGLSSSGGGGGSDCMLILPKDMHGRLPPLKNLRLFGKSDFMNPTIKDVLKTFNYSLMKLEIFPNRARKDVPDGALIWPSTLSILEKEEEEEEEEEKPVSVQVLDLNLDFEKLNRMPKSVGVHSLTELTIQCRELRFENFREPFEVLVNLKKLVLKSEVGLKETMHGRQARGEGREGEGEGKDNDDDDDDDGIVRWQAPPSLKELNLSGEPVLYFDYRKMEKLQELEYCLIHSPTGELGYRFKSMMDVNRIRNEKKNNKNKDKDNSNNNRNHYLGNGGVPTKDSLIPWDWELSSLKHFILRGPIAEWFHPILLWKSLKLETLDIEVDGSLNSCWSGGKSLVSRQIAEGIQQWGLPWQKVSRNKNEFGYSIEREEEEEEEEDFEEVEEEEADCEDDGGRNEEMVSLLALSTSSIGVSAVVGSSDEEEEIESRKIEKLFEARGSISEINDEDDTEEEDEDEGQEFRDPKEWYDPDQDMKAFDNQFRYFNLRRISFKGLHRQRNFFRLILPFSFLGQYPELRSQKKKVIVDEMTGKQEPFQQSQQAEEEGGGGATLESNVVKDEYLTSGMYGNPRLFPFLEELNFHDYGIEYMSTTMTEIVGLVDNHRQERKAQEERLLKRKNYEEKQKEEEAETAKEKERKEMEGKILDKGKGKAVAEDVVAATITESVVIESGSETTITTLPPSTTTKPIEIPRSYINPSRFLRLRTRECLDMGSLALREAKLTMLNKKEILKTNRDKFLVEWVGQKRVHSCPSKYRLVSDKW